jgi:hypothetical protein
MRGKELVVSILVGISTGVIANFVWAWLTPIAPLPQATPALHQTVERASASPMSTLPRSSGGTAPSADSFTFAEIRRELFPRQLHPILLTLLLLLRAAGVLCFSVIAVIHLYGMGYDTPSWFYRVPCHLVAVGVGAFIPEILLAIVGVAVFFSPLFIGAILLRYLLELPAKLRSSLGAMNTRKTTLPKQPGPHFAK